MNKTLADDVFEDEMEVENRSRRNAKRTTDPEATKPNWGAKRRVCDGCLKEQIFSYSEQEREEPEIGEDDTDGDQNENPWVTVQRRQKPSQNMSEEPSFKRGHFRGHKHPQESNLSQEEIKSEQIYPNPEATESQETDNALITCRSRSQGLAPEQMLPTRPIEYKKYTKRN